MAENQGQLLKEFLKNKGIGATKAAELLGVSRQTVYQYFKTSRFDKDTIDTLRRVFPDIKTVFKDGDMTDLIKENEQLKKDKEELMEKIIDLQDKLLDKSIQRDQSIKNDPVQR